MNWYSIIGLEYLRKSDPNFTPKETKLLSYLMNQEELSDFTLTITDRNLDTASSLENIKILKRKDKISYKLTVYGIKFIEDIRLRLDSMPRKYNLFQYIKTILSEKKITRKKLADITGISTNRMIRIFGDECKSVFIEEVEIICEKLSIDFSHIMKKILKEQWYRKMNLNYARATDMNYTISEINFLNNLLNNNGNFNKNTQERNNLFEVGMIEVKRDKYDNVLTYLTEQGLKFIEDILQRQKYFPELDIVAEEIREEIDKKEWDIDTLARKSSVNSEIISELLDCESSYGRREFYFYIEDLERLYEALYLDFNSMIVNFVSRKKEEINSREKAKKQKMGIPKRNTLIETTNLVPKKVNSFDKEQHINYKILISESPIETKLLKEIVNLADEFNFIIETQKGFCINNRKYRADIYIEIGQQKFLIECDGHDFHEKTKEQAQKDKQRDRDFISVGITTLRFTGSEINRDAKSCAREIFNTHQGYISNISM